MTKTELLDNISVEGRHLHDAMICAVDYELYKKAQHGGTLGYIYDGGAYKPIPDTIRHGTTISSFIDDNGDDRVARFLFGNAYKKYVNDSNKRSLSYIYLEAFGCEGKIYIVLNTSHNDALINMCEKTGWNKIIRKNNNGFYYKRFDVCDLPGTNGPIYIHGYCGLVMELSYIGFSDWNKCGYASIGRVYSIGTTVGGITNLVGKDTVTLFDKTGKAISFGTIISETIEKGSKLCLCNVEYSRLGFTKISGDKLVGASIIPSDILSRSYTPTDGVIAVQLLNRFSDHTYIVLSEVIKDMKNGRMKTLKIRRGEDHDISEESPLVATYDIKSKSLSMNVEYSEVFESKK